MPWGAEPEGIAQLTAAVQAAGGRAAAVAADLSDPTAPAAVLAMVNATLGPVTALVLSHCESVDSDLRSTSVESFDLHMAVNARASWLLEDALVELGVKFTRGEAWKPYTVVDRNLRTGQNPATARLHPEVSPRIAEVGVTGSGGAAPLRRQPRRRSIRIVRRQQWRCGRRGRRGTPPAGSASPDPGRGRCDRGSRPRHR